VPRTRNDPWRAGSIDTTWPIALAADVGDDVRDDVGDGLDVDTGEEGARRDAEVVAGAVQADSALATTTTPTSVRDAGLHLTRTG
jgi:hypothetical protein